MTTKVYTWDEVRAIVAADAEGRGHYQQMNGRTCAIGGLAKAAGLLNANWFNRSKFGEVFPMFGKRIEREGKVTNINDSFTNKQLTKRRAALDDQFAVWQAEDKGVIA